ncbi:phasin family protein [Acidovorax sp. HDW3]|uniref:phasin family protein n=1 Tax=Acidovorax sp. HDW3 TaxID=2714923 RepID=UPI0014088888|nr:phasin family protein [Acidovorax sp. HDW3]QIL42996.1 phasin family protein [Acidovorax sp. HDW3]
MVKKLQKISDDKKKPSAELPRAIKESAQQIWLAGLGAFAKAQEEGNKVFESLVKEGLSIQRKTQAVAEEKITEATSRVTHMANDIGSRAAGKWDKLESIFEDRVAKALSTLGVPTSRDIEALNARIDALAKSLGKAPPVAPAKESAKPAAKPAAAKKPAATKKPATKAAAKPVAKAATADKAPAKPAAKKAAAKPAAKAAAKPAATKRPPFPQVAPRAVEPAAAAAADTPAAAA